MFRNTYNCLKNLAQPFSLLHEYISQATIPNMTASITDPATNQAMLRLSSTKVLYLSVVVVVLVVVVSDGN